MLHSLYINMYSGLKVVIAPSILSCDFGYFADECKNILEAGADQLHIDIMDGNFVPNLTIGPPIIKALVKHLPQNTYLDCHLMVTKPQQYIESLAQAKASGITFHYESEYSSLESICKQIRAKNMKVGISLKPKTQIDEPLKQILQKKLVDMVLVMSVEPGFGGQSFMPQTMWKVKQLRGLYPTLNIQVDGGVILANISVVAESGANYIVSGTGIFGSKNRKQIITAMKKEMQAVFKTH